MSFLRGGENKNPTNANLHQNFVCVPQTYPGNQQRVPFYTGHGLNHASSLYINELKDGNREERKIEEERVANFEIKERENDERRQQKIDATHQKKLEQMEYAERLRNYEAVNIPKLERPINSKSNDSVNRNSFTHFTDEEVAESLKNNDCLQNIQGDDTKFLVVILIDESKSTLKHKNNIVEGVNKIINNQIIKCIDRTDSRMAILKFNESVNYLQKPSAQNLIEFIQLSDFNPNGGCKVYDGLHYALNMIEGKSNKTEKTLCLLFTLGEYSKSKCKSEELKFELRKINSHRLLKLCVFTLKPDNWIRKLELQQEDVNKFDIKGLNDTFKLMDHMITQFRDYYSS